jgi:hypothetical protein
MSRLRLDGDEKAKQGQHTHGWHCNCKWHFYSCSDLQRCIEYDNRFARSVVYAHQASFGKKKKKFFQDFHGIVSGAQGEKDFFFFFLRDLLVMHT